MSYILNALRKSEQQRIQSQPETLETSILRTKPAQKKSSFWLIVLIIVNMMFFGFIVFTLVKDDNPEEIKKIEKTIQSSQSVKKPVIEPKDSRHLSALDRIKINKIQQQISIAEKIKRQKSKAKLTKTQAEIIKSETRPRPRPRPDKTITKQEKRVPVITKLAKAVDSVKVSKADKKAKIERIPFLADLSYDFRRKVPDFDINVFVYSKDSKDRFIMVDMKKKVIDDLVLEGMLLKEIREESIVVEYKGKVFQIKRN